MNKRYGLGYMGSKDRLARMIVAEMPPAEVFVDAFAGGCAVSHAALVSGKYKKVIANDLSGLPGIFRDVITGAREYHGEWVSSEEFMLYRDSDPWVAEFWSFYYDQRSYWCSKKLEPYKKALHEAVYAEDPNERLLRIGKLGRMLEHALSLKDPELTLGRIMCSRVIASLEGLRNLAGIEALRRESGRFMPIRGDYREVPIPENSVVYADPPYKGTAGYVCGKFDHDAFYEWCRSVKAPLYVSEYNMPEDFECIRSWKFTRLCHAVDEKRYSTERLFTRRGE